jgi:hypothetical protein
VLNLLGPRANHDCSGLSRREFLSVGTLGLAGLTTADLLRARAAAAEVWAPGSPAGEAEGKAAPAKPAGATAPADHTAVVWLFMNGGVSHIETFDPKMTAPAGIRSLSGEVPTNLPGVTFGGLLGNLARVADKMAVVRSFAHNDSNHSEGMFKVMTGRDFPRNARPDQISAGPPSIGAMIARHRGLNHPVTGMPSYVVGGRAPVEFSGGGFLGNGYNGFTPNGQGLKDMGLNLSRAALDDRRGLLRTFDTLHRDMDSGGAMAGLDRFEQQAYDMIFGQAAKAFDLRNEPAKTREGYKGQLGRDLLLARRLVEAGCSFITINHGFYDSHENMKEHFREDHLPTFDAATATFIRDLYARGLDRKVLLVIAGEFGRTPKVNRTGGRDHWPNLSTLALCGGGLRMGQVIGESAAGADVPKSRAIRPEDLLATIFHVLGMPQDLQFTNPAGRPVYMIEGGEPIRELV